MFERSVNPEGSETTKTDSSKWKGFERSVNPEGSETPHLANKLSSMFERSVNPEGSETEQNIVTACLGLREV